MRLRFVAVSVMNCWNKLPKKVIVYVLKLDPFLENRCQPNRNYWTQYMGKGAMLWSVTQKRLWQAELMVLSGLKSHEWRKMFETFSAKFFLFHIAKSSTNPKETLRQIVSGAASSVVLERITHIKCTFHLNMQHYAFCILQIRGWRPEAMVNMLQAGTQQAR